VAEVVEGFQQTRRFTQIGTEGTVALVVEVLLDLLPELLFRDLGLGAQEIRRLFLLLKVTMAVTAFRAEPRQRLLAVAVAVPAVLEGMPLLHLGLLVTEVMEPHLLFRGLPQPMREVGAEQPVLVAPSALVVREAGVMVVRTLAPHRLERLERLGLLIPGAAEAVMPDLWLQGTVAPA
jgi:hypothetical protein